MPQYPHGGKRTLNPKSYICVNEQCSNGQPHWAGFGKQSSLKCLVCGQQMRVIQGEPYGTPHAR